MVQLNGRIIHGRIYLCIYLCTGDHLRTTLHKVYRGCVTNGSKVLKVDCTWYSYRLPSYYTTEIVKIVIKSGHTGQWCTVLHWPVMSWVRGSLVWGSFHFVCPHRDRPRTEELVTWCLLSSGVGPVLGESPGVLFCALLLPFSVSFEKQLWKAKWPVAVMHTLATNRHKVKEQRSKKGHEDHPKVKPGGSSCSYPRDYKCKF